MKLKKHRVSLCNQEGRRGNWAGDIADAAEGEKECQKCNKNSKQQDHIKNTLILSTGTFMIMFVKCAIKTL